ncbi:hypothetical protein NQ314_013112 [Rhamnusium bicolor]|uniref:Regulatory protein zeste n=1 Tax=Rhamnusium bicolor TaxID=1586634 RepID=A0AAV8X8G6_9CUCU|nr:hypothetical protein NQ314_013112 [Rhamnusium bicolor]
MAAKSKRVIYSDADCHRLVDIVISYRIVIECKKTDATTWKQKNTTWGKITETYNAGTTEPRTSEQLRCKYDNLKKEVRQYEAKRKRNLFKTGGGVNKPDVKAILKLLYEKIKSIICFSVDGLDASQGDSDMTVEMLDNNVDKFDADTSIIDFTSENLQPMILNNVEVPEDVLDNTTQPLVGTSQEVNKDWSDYTPKMLQTKKHTVLQLKRKKRNTEVSEDDDSENLKLKMFNLKKDLLEKEAAREEVYHQMKMKKRRRNI